MFNTSFFLFIPTSALPLSLLALLDKLALQDCYGSTGNYCLIVHSSIIVLLGLPRMSLCFFNSSHLVYANEDSVSHSISTAVSCVRMTPQKQKKNKVKNPNERRAALIRIRLIPNHHSTDTPLWFWTKRLRNMYSLWSLL